MELVDAPRHRGRPVRAGRVRRLARAAGTVIASGVLLVVCGLLVLTVAVPIAAGASTYTVLTRSMEPGLPPGTLLVVRPESADGLHAGDVVTYQLQSGEPDVVTHRIVRVEVSSDGRRRYITRGDANAVADPNPVRPEQVKGRVWYAVPAVGWLAIVRNSAALQPWLAGIGALLVLYAVVSIFLWARGRRRAVPGPVTARDTYRPL